MSNTVLASDISQSKTARVGSIQKIEKEFYEADVAMLDRYQAFSGELLRVSLLGIGVVGFFAEKLAAALGKSMIVKGAAWCAVGGFAAAMAFALAHRYFSTDGMFYHLRAVRRESQGKDSNDEREDRNRIFARSGQYLGASALCFGFGVIALGVAILVLLGLL